MDKFNFGGQEYFIGGVVLFYQEAGDVLLSFIFVVLAVIDIKCLDTSFY